jgi:hypothetical protein
MVRSPCIGVGVLTLGISCLVLADGPSDTLPPADMTRLITAEIKFIQETLAKPKVVGKSAGKVKMSALLIAHYAQTGMTKDNAKEMATLRDQALRLIKAMNDEPKAAKKLAGNLSAKPKADPAVKTDKISLTSHLEVAQVMRIFSSTLIGGFAIEKELDDLANMSGAVPAGKQEYIVDLAHKLAMIGTLAHAHYTPDQDEAAGKTRKNWQMFADNFRDASLGMAEAARTKRDIGIAANAVMLSCTKCHDVFRKQP